MEKYDVVNIGIIVADVPVKIPFRTLDFKTDTIRVGKLDVLPGGDAANSSIALGYLGRKVALAGALGNDALGCLVKEMIGLSGVDVANVHLKENVATSTSVVLINNEGERTFVCTRGNNQTLCAADVDKSLIQKTKHINLSSLFAHPLFEKEGGAAFFEKAKNAGLTISADTGHDNYDTGFEGIAHLLRYVDIFMPSYAEAKYMSKESDPERMAAFFTKKTGEKTVVVKLGEEGCFVRQKGKGYRVPAYRVEAVDTTGAGDNFLAGFLSAYLDGAGVLDCARFACAAAALSTTQVGATSRVTTVRAVRALMEEQMGNAHERA